MALPKIFKIKKTNFAKIFSQGKTVQNSFFFTYYIKTDLNLNRFATIVSSKVSAKATIRNKIRRRIQATIIKNILNLKTGFDIIISARPKVKDQKFLQLESSLMEIFKKANTFLS